MLPLQGDVANQTACKYSLSWVYEAYWLCGMLLVVELLHAVSMQQT